MRVFVYDTTLRDGTQGENVSFSVDDKLSIARKLDAIGIDYIEGGWPGSNPRDEGFFERAKTELALKHARPDRLRLHPARCQQAARRRERAQARGLGNAGRHDFRQKLGPAHRAGVAVSEEQNREMIASTVAYLKALGREVIYDAEHFFDGYESNRDFALRTLEAAQRAGADALVLCDTNGGTLTARLAEIVADVRKSFDGILGIHTHNDSRWRSPMPSPRSSSAPRTCRAR